MYKSPAGFHETQLINIWSGQSTPTNTNSLHFESAFSLALCASAIF